MSGPCLRLALAAGLLHGAIGPVLADLEPPDPGRYIKWGPFRVRPGLEISNLGYDDNILVTGVDPVSDYTATISPKVDGLVLFGHRAFVEFESKVELTFYRDNTDQNFENYKNSGRATFPLQNIGVFVDGILNRVRERPIDREDIRPDRDRDTLGLGLIFHPAWRTEIEIGRTTTHWTYFDEDEDPSSPTTIGDRLDRRELRDHLEVSYRLLGRTSLTFDAYDESVDFDDPISKLKNSRERAVLPGVDFGRGGGLSGSARLGWTWIDPDNPALHDFDDLAGDAKLAYRLGARTTIDLEGRREPGFTASGTSVYFLSTSVRLHGVVYLNSFLGLEAGGGYGLLTFPGPAEDRQDDLDSYEIGVRLRRPQDSLGQRVEYSLKLKHSRRNSTEDSLDNTRTTLSLGAVLGY